MLQRMWVWSFSVLVLWGCGGEHPGSAGSRARPITTAPVQFLEPEQSFQATGVIRAFREEQIAFEVSGRLVSVKDVGFEAKGAVYDGELKLIKEGTTIAELDSTRYVLAREAARLSKVAAEKNKRAMEIDLEEVARSDLKSAQSQRQAAKTEVDALVENLKAAEADRDLAFKTRERQRNLVLQGASAQATLDEAVAAYKSADANVKRLTTELRAKRESLATYDAAIAAAQAAIHLKEAQIQALQAEIDQLQQSFETAQHDVESCKLRAPFDGRIAVQHVGRGTFVTAGKEVVTLTMFDPVKVAVSLSAEQNRLIRQGTPARIRVRGKTRGELAADLRGRRRAARDRRGGNANVCTRHHRAQSEKGSRRSG